MTIFHVIQYPNPLRSRDSFLALPEEVTVAYLKWFKENFNLNTVIDQQPNADKFMQQLLLEYDPEVHDV